MAKDIPPKPKPVPAAKEAAVKVEDDKARNDISTFWKKAVERYERENGINVTELQQSGEFEGADSGVEKASQLFAKSRHPENGKGEFIAAVGGCLDWIDTTVGFVSNHIEGTYATPAKVLAGAISKMVQAANDLSADFNLIDETFESINNAMKDIGLLENRHIAGDHFANRLMDIFVSLFDFCSFGLKMFKEYSRKRLYLRALLKGRNDKIKAKCDGVNKVILLFRATVPIKILSIAERLDEKLDNFPDSFIKALQGMRLKPSDLQLLTPKSVAIEKIRRKFPSSTGGKARIDTQMELIGSRYVAETFAWLANDANYKTWLKGQNTPFLCVTGAQGTGKTYFTYQCYQLTRDLNKSRQNVSVACFFFDPGKSETQSLKSALESIIMQLAGQDSKYCDMLAKELEDDKAGKSATSSHFDAEDMWKRLIRSKFEKVSESSRVAYLLLDGVEQLEDEDGQILLKVLRELNSDKDGIQVMMTGSATSISEMQLKCGEISLVEKTSKEGDVEKIIRARISRSESLREFSNEGQTVIIQHLTSINKGILFLVDLTLSLMEQTGDEASAIKKMKSTFGRPEGLYASMIELVLNPRSEAERNSVQTLFEWCTYSKRPLSVHEMQQIWSLDSSLGDFDVQSEIQGKSKSVLYTARRLTDDDEDAPAVINSPAHEGSPGTLKSGTDAKADFIAFRQASLKEHLENEPNSMIINPLTAKIRIFVTLCEVLCDRNPAEVEPRRALQEYAMFYFVDHLLDIPVKNTTAEQGRDVVEALARVLTNENDVCTVFENILEQRQEWFTSFTLYDGFGLDDWLAYDGGQLYRAEDGLVRIFLSWARKMSYEEFELFDVARDWVRAAIKQPERILEPLARGHTESWLRKVTFAEAKYSYNLAYRSLAETDRIEKNWAQLYIDIATKDTVKIMMDFALEKRTVKPARARIAAAVLLNGIGIPEDVSYAAELYQKNLEKSAEISGPERFYSYLGLAAYYSARLLRKCEGFDGAWEKISDYSQKALEERELEKGALGSDLNSESCIEAFSLRAEALQQLGQDDEALKVCHWALEPDELDYSHSLHEFIDKIVSIYSKRQQWSNIVSEIQHCPHLLRVAWLKDRAQRSTDKADQVRKAAVLTNRVDFLVHVYEEAIEHWQTRDWSSAQQLKCDLAVIYKRDVRATRMSEIVLDDIIISVKEKLPSTDSGSMLRRIFPEMTDVLFEEYTLAYSKDKKKLSLTKLSNLIRDLEQTGIVTEISLASSMITLAKMLKDFGNIEKAKLEANGAFKRCLNDLQDSIGYNDAFAFGVLSKVLFFIGLKADAHIAQSLTFSDVDKTYDDRYSVYYEPSVVSETSEKLVKENGDQENPPVADKAENLTAEASLPIPNGTNGEVLRGHGSKTVENTDVEEKALSENVASEEGIQTNTKAAKSTEVQVNGTDTGSLGVDAVKGEMNDKETTDGVPPSSNNVVEPVSSTTINAQQQVEKAPIPTIEENDEEVIREGNWSVKCNGPCSSDPLSRWPKDTHWYRCLDCADVDLCSECYSIQDKFFKETGDGFWLKVCWAEHDIIRQPMEAWRGVKDGVIRIGSKNKPFKDWLDEIRVKWERKMAVMV